MGSFEISQIIRVNNNTSNVSQFMGLPVRDYDPDATSEEGVAYRFSSDWDEDRLKPHLEHYLSTPAAAEAKALVIGPWQGDDSSNPSKEVVDFLVSQAQKLPNLEALFLGDISYEENEMSWIIQSDLSPLLKAFPKLKYLRSRGGEDLALSDPSHTELRALTMESGGMAGSVVRSLAGAKFPQLESLELWLGTDEYGASVSADDLAPLVNNGQFPKLKYLGLRNSDIADEVAKALAGSSVVARIEQLDLSLGTLTDAGAEHLLSLKSESLKTLNLFHHYLSPEMAQQLSQLPFQVNVANPDHMESDPEYRYVAVGE